MIRRRYLLSFLLIILTITMVGCKHVHIFDTLDEVQPATFWSDGTEFWKCECGERIPKNIPALLSNANGIYNNLSTNNGEIGSVEVVKHNIGTKEIETAVLRLNSANNQKELNYGPNVEIGIFRDFYGSTYIQRVEIIMDFGLLTENSYFGIDYSVSTISGDEIRNYRLYYFFIKGNELNEKSKIVLIEDTRTLFYKSTLDSILEIYSDPSYDFTARFLELDSGEYFENHVYEEDQLNDLVIGSRFAITERYNQAEFNGNSFNVKGDRPDHGLGSISDLSPRYDSLFNDSVQNIYLSRIDFFNISSLVPVRSIRLA
jgi:hypothetical protein